MTKVSERRRKARAVSLQSLEANIQAMQRQIADLSDALSRLTPPVYQTVSPSSRVIPPEAGGPKTGAELIALWEKEGAFITGDGQPDSPEYARQIRERSQSPREHLQEWLNRQEPHQESH